MSIAEHMAYAKKQAEIAESEARKKEEERKKREQV